MPSAGTPVVSLPRTVCAAPAEAAEREWLETNGKGSYALGTVMAGNTRRYHGLLTVARRPPADRWQWVNRLEETVVRGGQRVDLACQQYPDVLHPRGFERLDSFRLDPFPIWTYVWDDGKLEKSFFLRYGEDTAVVTYRWIAGPPVELEIRPLLSGRDPHALAREDGRFVGQIQAEKKGFRAGEARGGVTVLCSDGEFRPDASWYRNQVYLVEEQRGLDRSEDVFCPGVFRLPLVPGQPVRLLFSTERDHWAGVDHWEDEERQQRRRIVRSSLVRGSLGGALSSAADQFIVARGKGAGVIAGYPWFGEWSRDALIAFPGLFLATGRWSEAPGMLDTFVRHVHQGLLPNFFPEGGESPAYNAVDAPLWLIRAVQAYHRATHDDDSVRRWWPVLRDIVDAYQNGTEYDIHMDGDGLIIAPPGDRALTWMDAMADARPVTPRGGKAVEIQALWYNALQFLVEIQLKWKEPARGYDQLAQVARRSFNEKFWNAEGRCLYDVVDGRRRDAALRPNGLLALSLPYEILEEKYFKPLVETCQRDLLTLRGLRTLAPGDPGYRGRYTGNVLERDRAYHQGTVWPWLLGPYLTAAVKAFGSTDETKEHVIQCLRPLRLHLNEAGLGQISEIFDGDSPHAPRGCPAQAWSVAELLRVMWEEGITL